MAAGRAVAHLMGDPALGPEAELAYRRRLTESALESLLRPLAGPLLVSVAGDGAVAG